MNLTPIGVVNEQLGQSTKILEESLALIETAGFKPECLASNLSALKKSTKTIVDMYSILVKTNPAVAKSIALCEGIKENTKACSSLLSPPITKSSMRTIRLLLTSLLSQFEELSEL